MSTSTQATPTSVTSAASVIISDLLTASVSAQSTIKTDATTTKIRSIVAGASEVASSSSVFALNLASSSSVVQQYKTIYVTKTAEPNSNASPSSSDLPPGAIAGIAIGGLVVIALIIGLVYIILRRRRKAVLETSEPPTTSGSQTTIVGKKSESNMSELYGSQDQPIHEAHGKVVYEMEASMPELDGRSSSLGSSQSLKKGATATSRHIMSRGRPV